MKQILNFKYKCAPSKDKDIWGRGYPLPCESSCATEVLYVSASDEHHWKLGRIKG